MNNELRDYLDGRVSSIYKKSYYYVELNDSCVVFDGENSAPIFLYEFIVDINGIYIREFVIDKSKLLKE